MDRLIFKYYPYLTSEIAKMGVKCFVFIYVSIMGRQDGNVNIGVSQNAMDDVEAQY